MKIKTKKQFTLPQLIEWLLNSKYSSYIAFSNMGNYVQLEEYGALSFSDEKFYPEETFTVEVEEEVTEDTRLDKLVVRYRNDDIYIFPQERINDFKNDSSIVAFYIPNDDLTMTLIWLDGKLVE